MGFDSIWVIVDRLTKSAHFLSVDTRYTARKYAEIYFDQIVTLHGVPLTIISDRGLVFVSHFWEQSRNVWVLVFSEAQLTTHKLMVRLKG